MDSGFNMLGQFQGNQQVHSSLQQQPQNIVNIKEMSSQGSIINNLSQPQDLRLDKTKYTPKNDKYVPDIEELQDMMDQYMADTYPKGWKGKTPSEVADLFETWALSWRPNPNTHYNDIRDISREMNNITSG